VLFIDDLIGSETHMSVPGPDGGNGARHQHIMQIPHAITLRNSHDGYSGISILCFATARMLLRRKALLPQAFDRHRVFRTLERS
jgi:hypothetical protein